MNTTSPTPTEFHAHVYYDADTKPLAAELRAEIEDRFDIVMGHWRDKPVGPHPFWSYQVAFKPELFGEIIPWLALNRRDLQVLVHPDTGDDLIDHSAYAMWLGESAELNLERFRARAAAKAG